MGCRLADGYDLVVLDLDGVVFLVDHPVPGAVEAISQLHQEGRPIAYATNNASRRATEVAELLTGMGIAAAADEVLTSAQAAATVLADELRPGAPVFVVGARALREEVSDVGLTVVASAQDAPEAVVQGYGPDVGWTDLAEACVAVRAGALWVATNTDRTLPTGRGPLPGNGSLVAALVTALDRQPDVVVGKPGPALFTAAARRANAQRALVVGDRLDTDIAGAVRAGMDSLLVLTGISGPAAVLAAAPDRRPTHLAADLSGLFQAEDAVRIPAEAPAADSTADAGWRVAREGTRLVLDGFGEPVAALRALCAPAWWATDAGVPVDDIVPATAAATAALAELRLR